MKREHGTTVTSLSKLDLKQGSVKFAEDFSFLKEIRAKCGI